MMLRNRKRTAILVLFVGLLSAFSNQVQAQFQVKILNKDTYDRLKLEFPKADFVDVVRKHVVTYEEPPAKSEEPFIWRHSQEIDRISLSNKRYHYYQLLTHDFLTVERANFWRVADKSVQIEKLTPQIEMIESDGAFHSNYKVHSYVSPVKSPGEIWRAKVSYLVNSVAHGSVLSFSEGRPAEKAIIELNMPVWAKVRFERLNFEGYDIEESITEKKGMVTYTFTMKNVPATKDEAMEAGALHFLPFVIVIPEELNHPKRGKIRVFKDATDTYEWNKKMVDRTENKSEQLTSLVQQLTDGKSDYDKIASIYYWVQENIRYVAFENGLAGFVPDNCQNVLSKKYGDCKGTANLLKEMLVLAGFDARLVWIGTKNKIPLSKEIPTIATSNHMIAAVAWEGDWLILDGTSRYAPLGEYSDQNQGQEIMIEGKNGPRDFIMSKVPEQPAINNKIQNLLHLELDASTSELKGHQKTTIQGNPRSDFRYYYNRTAQKDRNEMIERFISAGQSFKGFSNLTYDISADWRAPIQVEADVLFQNQVMVLQDEIYLPTMVYKSLKQFQLPDDRQGDLTLSEKMYVTDTLVYDIPLGYEVQYVPANLDLDRGKYQFSALVATNAKQITIARTIIVNDFIIKRPDFERWNGDIKALKAFYDDRIILKKK